jgi:hypothetical protein
MMLYTERRAVQNTDIDRLRRIAQWYVMEKESSYGQTLIRAGEEERFGVVPVWENSRWVLWRFLPREVVETVPGKVVGVLSTSQPSIVINTSASTG